MTMDYLIEVERVIDSGRPLYACAGHQGQEWFIDESLDDIRKRAKRTANAKKSACTIYRLINRMDTGEGDSYLTVRRILEPGPKGEPHLSFILVDTREAAEMLRDVSQGPTPYFGATLEETIPAS
jgi:hypothetical protein